jgi:hypothetical protein
MLAGKIVMVTKVKAYWFRGTGTEEGVRGFYGSKVDEGHECRVNKWSSVVDQV